MPIIKISPNIKAQRDWNPKDKMRDTRRIYKWKWFSLLIQDITDYYKNYS